MLKKFLIALIAVAAVVRGAPLYGEDGGYSGYASYVPFGQRLSRSSLHEEDSREGDGIHASAGSPEMSRRSPRHPSNQGNHENIPKNDEALNYAPASQYGYGSNRVAEDSPAPYSQALRGSGGYKLSDAYQNQHIDLHADKEHDYKDDYQSYPQPYEFGYALKDEHGNVQHRKESSDGQGKVEGTYGYMDEHGLYRSVEYIADKEGYRASIKTNEPGVENQDPADVHIEHEGTKY